MLQDEDVPMNELYERGELLLYKATVLREGGKFVKALAVLDNCRVYTWKLLGSRSFAHLVEPSLQL